MKPDQTYFGIWQQHSVNLCKSDIYGYGIAISGGIPNGNGLVAQDTSVHVSDVIQNGPADGKLLVNDIILSINGINVQNAEHHFVVSLLKESNNFIRLIIMRKEIPSTTTTTTTTRRDLATSQHNKPNVIDNNPNQMPLALVANTTINNKLSIRKPFKIQLIKKDRNDNLGLVLGSKYYIKDITRDNNNNSDLCGLKVGDCILKINDMPVDQLSLSDARKMFAKAKEKLNLLVRRPSAYDKDEVEVDNNDDDDGEHEWTSDSDEPVSSYHANGLIESSLYSNNNNGTKLSKSMSQPMGLNYRKIRFYKENGIGIRITGGNRIGIFVCDVQINSTAERAGLQIADKIFQVNDVDYDGLTREDAVQHILGLHSQIDMIVVNMPDDYKASFDPIGGDSFYIRPNFNFTGTVQDELDFKINDILHVTDTLFNGIIGHWVATRINMIDDGGQMNKKGIIPNETTAKQLIANAPTIEQVQASAKLTLTKRFRNSRRSNRTSNSNVDSSNGNFRLSKANTYDPKYAVYERVALREANFIRPVVIFGALADIARDKLTNEYKDKYELPFVNNASTSHASQQGVIKLASIKNVIEKGVHCVLDITPNAIEHLNYAQYYPIVVFLKSETHGQVKELRQKYLKTSKVRNSRRLHDNSIKLQAYYSHLFTGVSVSLETSNWFKKLKNTIDLQQKQPIWITEPIARKQPPIPTTHIRSFIKAQSDAYPRPQVQSNTTTTTTTTTQPKAAFYNTTRSNYFDDNFELQLYNANLMRTQSGYDSESDYGVCEQQQTTSQFNRPQSVYSSYGELKRIHAKQGCNTYADYTDSYEPSRSSNLVRIYSDSNLFKSDSYDGEQNGVSIPIEHESYHNGSSSNHGYSWNQMDQFASNKNGCEPDKPMINSLDTRLNHLKIKDNIDIFDRLYRVGQQPNNYACLDETKAKIAANKLNTNNVNRDSFNSLKRCNEAYKFTRSTAMPLDTTNTLTKTSKPTGMLKTSVTTSMIDSLKRSMANQTTSKMMPPPLPPPPPIMPKPSKSLVNSYMLSQRGTVKSKSAVDISKLNRTGPQHVDTTLFKHRQQPHNQPTSSTASSSSPSSSSMSTNQNSNVDKPMDAKQGESKVNKKLKSLEMNSLKSSSQGYYSDTSRSSKQSFEFESVRANLRNVKKPPQFNETENSNKDLSSSVTASSLSDVSTGLAPITTITSIDAHEVLDMNKCTFPSNLYFKETNYESINKELTGRSCSAHYNDNGSYRRVSIDSNDVCTIISSLDGIFDSRGGILDCANTGVSLYIPEDAIPKDTSYEVYFKVCHSQSFLDDDESTLIYPVVMCGPRGLKFVKPIELIIPNFILIDDKSWSYTVTSPDGKLNSWTEDGEKTLKNAVSVLIDHF